MKLSNAIVLALVLGACSPAEPLEQTTATDPLTELSRLLNEEGLIYIPEVRDSVNNVLEASFGSPATRPDQIRQLTRWVEEWRETHPEQVSKARNTLRMAQESMDDRLRTKP